MFSNQRTQLMLDFRQLNTMCGVASRPTYHINVECFCALLSTLGKPSTKPSLVNAIEAAKAVACLSLALAGYVVML